MTPKIRELADEVRFTREDPYPHQDVIFQRFAELLIRECISKCEFVANMATITNTGEMARKTKATADSCATMIKQHFGVSE